MDVIDFFNVEIDPISNTDIRNGHYMIDLLDEYNYELNDLPQVSLKDAFIKSLSTFELYKNRTLLESVFEKKKKFDYVPIGAIPFHFNTQMFVGDNNQIVPSIVCPRILDEASYAFLGHEFHHAVKDLNPKERKIRDRVAEVIPMFYEMICSDIEPDENVSKEILKRRLALLELDKQSETEDKARRLQYFNSYYYALALYNKYRKEENKLLVLRLISRVLMEEISTLDLLKMLNIYDQDVDYNVSWELEMIKEYIRK